MAPLPAQGVRTARKLLIGFGLGLVFVAICSVAGLTYLTQLNGIIRHLAYDPVPGAAAIAKISKDFEQYRQTPRAAKADDIQRDLKAYDDTITQEDDRRQFAVLVGMWSQYTRVDDLGAREATAERIDALLPAMIEWNRLEGLRSIEKADSATRAASATVLSMLVAAVLLSAMALYFNSVLEESREQMQRLAGGLLVAREEERTRIAREIHDSLGQALTALKMDVAWINRRSPDETTADKLAGMVTLIDDSVVTVRRIATDLRPGVLDDLGLAAAVEWQGQEFERRTGILCVLAATVDDGALDPLVSTAAFRIFQESLTNVARHSRASRVAVTLERFDADLILDVHDDGVGIGAADASNVRSIGLAGMRERAQLVGGGFSISGAAGAGTRVRVRIPWRERASA